MADDALQLRQTLQSTRSPTMPGPEVLVAQAHELVNEDGVPGAMLALKLAGFVQYKTPPGGL